MFSEVRQRTLPRKRGRLFVVARRRVVVKTVLRSGVGEHLIGNARGLQRGFKRGVGFVDTFVLFSQMAQEGCLDVADARRIGGNAVIGYARAHFVPQRRRQVIDNAATIAKANDAQFAVGDEIKMAYVVTDHGVDEIGTGENTRITQTFGGRGRVLWNYTLEA